MSVILIVIIVVLIIVLIAIRKDNNIKWVLKGVRKYNDSWILEVYTGYELREFKKLEADRWYELNGKPCSEDDSKRLGRLYDIGKCLNWIE